MICKEQKVGVKEPFHTAFEAVFLGQTVTNKEDRVVCLRKNSKGHLRRLGAAESIQNKMPPRQDSRSGLHKRFEPVYTEEVNAHPSVLFNFHEVGCLDFLSKSEIGEEIFPFNTPLCFEV